MCSLCVVLTTPTPPWVHPPSPPMHPPTQAAGPLLASSAQRTTTAATAPAATTGCASQVRPTRGCPRQRQCWLHAWHARGVTAAGLVRPASATAADPCSRRERHTRRVRAQLSPAACACCHAAGCTVLVVALPAACPKPAPPSARVVRVDASSFPAATTDVITFGAAQGSPLNTLNPTYTPANYSAKCPAGAPTLTTRGYFQGQRVSSDPATDCPAVVAPDFCIVGAPSSPLTLAAAGTSVRIWGDAAVPTSPVLSGPRFTEPVAVLFSPPVSAVGVSCCWAHVACCLDTATPASLSGRAQPCTCC
jgi:hypothetical protein